MHDFKDYTTRKQEVDKQYLYKFSHKEEEIERLEKLKKGLALIDNTPLSKDERETEIKRVKKLYWPGSYKSEKRIQCEKAYETAIEEMEAIYLIQLKEYFTEAFNCVDKVFNVCYSRAYEKASDGGYGLDGVVDFLKEEIEYLIDLEKLLGIKIITK